MPLKLPLESLAASLPEYPCGPLPKGVSNRATRAHRGKAGGQHGGNIGPFIGDDDLVSHILRLMKRGPLTVEVSYCTPIPSQGVDRTALAQAAHTAICTVVAPAQLVGERSVPAPRQSLAA